MRRAPILALGACLLAALGPSRAEADTVTLEATADTSLFSEDGTLSNGAGDYFFAGANDNGDLRRALLRFDAAGSIPAGSTITAVTLTLHLSRTKANDVVVSLHRLGTAFVEGTSDAENEEGTGITATGGDATWTHASYPATPWTTAGGDYAGSASASTTVGKSNGFYSFSGAGLVADVQAFVDGSTPEHGWIVIGAEGATRVAKRFDSRTHPTVENRPSLEITFTPGSPSGACCSGSGACTVVADPGGDCAGAYQGSGTVCSPNPCPQPPAPTGACCQPDASATCTVETSGDCASAGGTFRGQGTSCSPNPCPVVLEPYVDPLPLPPVARPASGSAGAEASYTISIVEIEQQLHRDLPPTTVWGFDDGVTGGTFPGPTLEAREGAPITVTWVNDLRGAGGGLRSEHVLSVDTCAHGAEDASPRTVIHLHGGHVPAEVDGYPESTVLPGESVVYPYPNRQRAATLWYHDHALGITRLNVYMGMAGFYLVRDDEEEALDLPSGAFEIPLVIQDRRLRPDGSLAYPSEWQEHFFGDTILVNGVVWPYLEVTRGKYRLRLLNGSNSRTYELAFSDGRDMVVIANDGGLLEAPVAVSSLRLSPGERYEVVVDFAGAPIGTQIELENSAPAPYPGGAGQGVVEDIMRFDVVDGAAHTAPMPATLAAIDAPTEAEAVETRELTLQKDPDPCSGSVWLIDGLGWDDITEFPALGTTEVWSFVNRSGIAHPMHMHLVFFRVLDRQPFEIVGGQISPIGSPTAPSPEEAGFKDTVMVDSREIVRVVARFEDYVGRFPYHCHILEHEDHEMMRQFETTTECGDGARGEPVEECDDGNTLDGDGCSASCTLEANLDGGAGGRSGDADGGPSSGDGGSGCSCHATGRSHGHGEGPAAGLASLLLFAIFWRSRRRSGRS